MKSYLPEGDVQLISDACRFAVKAHRGQTRRSGKPYVVHPLGVAFLLAKMNMDESCVAAGALHDTLENTRTTLGELRRLFGNEVAALVDGVTNIGKQAHTDKDHRRAEGFRKMLRAMTWDQRVFIVKLADRMHNMRTLDAMPTETQKRIATESLRLYVPMASRLGIYCLAQELEGLAFLYLQPEQYGKVKKLRDGALGTTRKLERRIAGAIRRKLEQIGVDAVIKLHRKSIGSTYRWMMANDSDLREMHDLTTYRVLLPNESDCYSVLRWIHTSWKPLAPFKDYIARPKANMYRSLQTTVSGPDHCKTEIHLRTHAMERMAERGLISHWSPEHFQFFNFQEAIEHIRELVKSDLGIEDPLLFSQAVARDLAGDDQAFLISQDHSL
ncbi:HD domain-containing protein [Thermodesulfobacteriota bacterium]